jgi:KaiC/GvpD/RAD55 family RecA-like ATPase
MVDAVIEGIRERVSVAIQVNQSVGIQVPENRHGDLLEAVFNSMCRNTHDIWTFVTVSKTFDYLTKTFKEGTRHPNIKFIDCISRAAGISDNSNNCIFLESPVMLENLILEIINNFKSPKRDMDKYIVIDSLSALMIYNDPEIIREFISLVMNRSRAENIHVVSILVEEEMDSNKLIQLNDKIIVLRDSFID